MSERLKSWSAVASRAGLAVVAVAAVLYFGGRYGGGKVRAGEDGGGAAEARTMAAQQRSSTEQEVRRKVDSAPLDARSTAAAFVRGELADRAEALLKRAEWDRKESHEVRRRMALGSAAVNRMLESDQELRRFYADEWGRLSGWWYSQESAEIDDALHAVLEGRYSPEGAAWILRQCEQRQRRARAHVQEGDLRVGVIVKLAQERDRRAGGEAPTAERSADQPAKLTRQRGAQDALAPGDETSAPNVFQSYDPRPPGGAPVAASKKEEAKGTKPAASRWAQDTDRLLEKYRR
jgi:hypothetical protein